MTATYSGFGKLSILPALVLRASTAFTGSGNLSALPTGRLVALTTFAAGGRFCIYTTVRLGPKGPVSNLSQVGLGPTNNQVIRLGAGSQT